MAMEMGAQQASSLRDLLAEAAKNNPEILAAEREWRATTFLHDEISSRPDLQLTLQSFSVGSPLPGDGLSNNDFAYIGIGATQELPYPGKLQRKAAIADRAADEQLAQVRVASSKVAEQVKTAYIRLAYLQQTMTLLNASRSTLGNVIETELSRYGAGLGNQADVLRAQIQRTKLLREITMHHEQVAQVQADLKKALGRNQESPDVTTEDLTATSFTRSLNEILDSTKRSNPLLAVDTNTIAKQAAQVESARLAGKPDFSIGYMFERTGLDFPAYYVATFNVIFPKKKRVAAERAEAAERASAATIERRAHVEELEAEVGRQYAVIRGAEEELTEYRDGILPQSEAAYRSTLAAFGSNSQALSTVLSTLNDVLEVKRDYEQAVFEHETAIVRLETLSGEILR
jgi:outer membrane protein TolC